MYVGKNLRVHLVCVCVCVCVYKMYNVMYAVLLSCSVVIHFLLVSIFSFFFVSSAKLTTVIEHFFENL